MASHSIQLLYLPKASAGISTEAAVVPMNIYPLCRFKQSVARSTCYKQAGWKFRHNLVMQSMAIMLLFPTSCTVLTHIGCLCSHTAVALHMADGHHCADRQSPLQRSMC